jgi:hypothetical protein
MMIMLWGGTKKLTTRVLMGGLLRERVERVVISERDDT